MENNIDFQVDETLEKCILSTPRKSFFLFAGAGSGKTYSLVLLLKKKYIIVLEKTFCRKERMSLLLPLLMLPQMR